MQRLKVAIPPGTDRAVVDIVLRSRLRHATGEEYETEYQITFDHGGFALIDLTDGETGAQLDGERVATVVTSLTPAMEFLDKSDLQGALRLLSTELKSDPATTEAKIKNIMSGMA